MIICPLRAQSLKTCLYIPQCLQYLLKVGTVPQCLQYLLKGGTVPQCLQYLLKVIISYNYLS